MCKTLDVLQLDIESDSAVVVQAVGSLFMFYGNALTFGKIHSPFIMLFDRSMVLLIGVRIGHTVIESNANASRVQSFPLRSGKRSRLINGGFGLIEND